MLSGNLSFSLPLLKAMGRGSGVGFSLSYNSQNWRHDSGGTWNLGRDVGYGYGWKLLAGSIMPYWNGYFTVDHYTFTDATGAEYRLGINTGNVWTSTESIYLAYDANAGVLHFPDGTSWTMGCQSAGTEQDGGTLYPTVMEDTNGNQILINYENGGGVSWNNSSARIYTIEDVRAVNDGTGHYWTYQFSYNTDTPPHLTSIVNSIATGEHYTFSYSGITLVDPFTTTTSFGASTVLSQVTLPDDGSAYYSPFTCHHPPPGNWQASSSSTAVTLTGPMGPRTTAVEPGRSGKSRTDISTRTGPTPTRPTRSRTGNHHRLTDNSFPRPP